MGKFYDWFKENAKWDSEKKEFYVDAEQLQKAWPGLKEELESAGNAGR